MTGKIHNGRLLLPQKWTAQVCGVSVQHFQRWNVEAVLTEGRSKYYDVAQIVAERQDRKPASASSLTDERRRLTAAQAEKAEIANKVRRGELLEIEVVLDEVGAAVYAMRARILGLSAELAGHLESRDANFIRSELDTALRAALDELASSDFVEMSDAQKANGERVGGPKSAAKSGGQRGARKLAN